MSLIITCINIGYKTHFENENGKFSGKLSDILRKFATLIWNPIIFKHAI